MACRSTRQKLKDQADSAIKAINNVTFHLYNLDKMADGRSDYITNNLPSIMTYVDMIEKMLDQFADGL